MHILNSEGFISGDETGKIRAWIIGFNPDPVTDELEATSKQPTSYLPIPALETIDELTECSEV